MKHLPSIAALMIFTSLAAGCSGSSGSSAIVPAASAPVTASAHSGFRDGDTLGGVGDRPPLPLFGALIGVVGGATIDGVVLNASGAPVSGAQVIVSSALSLETSSRAYAKAPRSTGTFVRASVPGYA